jgi:hypothetical protein
MINLIIDEVGARSPGDRASSGSWKLEFAARRRVLNILHILNCWRF